MTTPQHPQHTPRPRLRILLLDDTRTAYVLDRAATLGVPPTAALPALQSAAGAGNPALVFAGEIDVEIVRDELPPSLRSVAPEPRPCARCDRPGAHKHPAPADDYVDQGDEPHEPDNNDRIDPWAHPKHERVCPVCHQPDPGITHEHDDADPCTRRSAHGLGPCVAVAGHEGPHTWQQPACTASRVISDADTHAAGRVAYCDSRDHRDGLHSGRVQSNDGTTTSRYTWPMEPDRAPNDRRILSLG